MTIKRIDFERGAKLAGKRSREATITTAFPARCIAQVLCAPLTDLRAPDEWWVWLSVASDEDGLDYEAEGPPSSDSLDDVEEYWYDYLRDVIGLADMVTDGHLTEWMLANGIAPKQPFLMRFYGYWSSKDYFGECDEGSESELVYVEPMSDVEAADNWHEWLKLL